MKISALLKQILFYSSARKKEDNIFISIQADKLRRIKETHKKEINFSLNEIFNSSINVSYDSKLELELSPFFIDQATNEKESNEAKDILSADVGFKKISSALEINLKNINKR